MSFMVMRANIDTKYKNETPSPPPPPIPTTLRANFCSKIAVSNPGRPKVPPPQAADINNMRVKKAN